jgi:uncharacterized protein YaeQ
VKFTFNLSLDGTHEEKLVIAAWKGEMVWHIALKLLGYLLHFEEHPRIEESVQWHYKPDLVARDETGKITLWIDCGNIAVRKIDRVATKIGAERFLILRRTRGEAARLDDAMEGRVKHRARVQLIAFADGFVDALAAHLDRTNDLEARRSENEIALVVSNRRGRFEKTSPLIRL